MGYFLQADKQVMQKAELSGAIANYLRETEMGGKPIRIFKEKPYELPRQSLWREFVLVKFGQDNGFESVLMCDYYAPSNEYLWPLKFKDEAIKRFIESGFIPTHTVLIGFNNEDCRFGGSGKMTRNQILDLAREIKGVGGVERVISTFWLEPVLVEEKG